MNSIHIEGMGITGCLLAHRLAMYGYEFTWHDIDLDRVAWPASTGAIYPAGSMKFGDDLQTHRVWEHWYKEGHFDRAHLEECSYIFGTKGAPHKGKYDYGPVDPADPDGLKIAEASSYHFNAQLFVPATRERFKDRRLSDRPPSKKTVVAHGWGERLDRVYWGWTRLVELEYDPVRFARPGKAERPCFYFRPNKFVMAYAYPVPGTPYWYAGSNIIQQRKDARKSLDMESKYEKWRTNFEQLAQGQVMVSKEADFIEGWRPAAAATDEKWVKVKRGEIQMRPLWNSGIRHFPQQWTAIAPILGLVP